RYISIHHNFARLSTHLSSSTFYLYVDHRDLPSFPTRRSSDLIIQLIDPIAEYCRSRAYIRTNHGGAIWTRGIYLDCCRLYICGRSEEHTSELQSRFDLVCRLLPEKKKKRTSRYRRRPNKTNDS